jgi:hypothetical protein
MSRRCDDGADGSAESLRQVADGDSGSAALCGDEHGRRQRQDYDEAMCFALIVVSVLVRYFGAHLQMISESEIFVGICT